MAEKKKKWMKQAFANSHGQFREKAESAGESTSEYAHEHEHDKSKLGKQARLAKIGIAAHHKHHKALTSHKKIISSMYGHKD